MNLGTNPTDNDAQALADLLSSRVETLAAVARDVAATIEADQAGHRGRSEMADELIDSVTARIAEIAADCDDLNRILTGFRSLMETTPAPAAPAPAPAIPAPPRPSPPVQAPSPPVTIAPGVTEYLGAHPVAPQTAPEAPTAPTAPTEHPRVSEGVRLLATQMSAAGSSHAEIARRLRDEFGVENSDLLVRELFGEPQPVPQSDTVPE